MGRRQIKKLHDWDFIILHYEFESAMLRLQAELQVTFDVLSKMGHGEIEGSLRPSLAIRSTNLHFVRRIDARAYQSTKVLGLGRERPLTAVASNEFGSLTVKNKQKLKKKKKKKKSTCVDTTA